MSPGNYVAVQHVLLSCATPEVVRSHTKEALNAGIHLNVCQKLLTAASRVCLPVARGLVLLYLPGRIMRDVAGAHEPVEFCLLPPQPLASCAQALAVICRCIVALEGTEELLEDMQSCQCFPF